MKKQLIDADALIKLMNEKHKHLVDENGWYDHYTSGYEDAITDVEEAPVVDAVAVVRCKDCVYFRERHIRLPDGTERDYADGEDYVTVDVGVNVGSQCRKEEEPCFREGGDFCSRGVKKEEERCPD